MGGIAGFCTGDGTAPFNGVISEVRLSSSFLYSTTPYDPDPRLTNVAGQTLALFHLSDSGPTAKDSSASSNNATASSGVSFVNSCTPGICNWARIGSTGNPTADVNASPAPNVFDPSSSFTLEGWFRENGAGGWSMFHGGQGGYGISLTNPTNKPNFLFTCQGGSPQFNPQASAVLPHLWYHTRSCSTPARRPSRFT